MSVAKTYARPRDITETSEKALALQNGKPNYRFLQNTKPNMRFPRKH